jgi:hypothetical protein
MNFKRNKLNGTKRIFLLLNLPTKFTTFNFFQTITHCS